jgi:hypothetical protein
MKCKKYKNLISGYIDGVLSDSERELLESHLKKCSDCRKDLELMQNYKKISASFEYRNAPDSIKDNVWRAISEDNAVRPGKRKGIVLPLNLPWLILAASILAFAIIIPSLTKSKEITVNFYNQSVGLVKGPKEKGEKAPEPDTRVEDVLSLAEKLECKIKNVYINPSGMTDRITVKVPKTRYDNFREKYNGFNPGDTLPGLSFRSMRGSLIIQVYFSGRKK